MVDLNACTGLLKRLVNDRSGNFAILTAIAIPLLLATGGVAVDVSNMVLSKNQLQTATDSAALATATALAQGSTTLLTAPQLGKDFVSGTMSNYLGTDATTLAALKANTTVSIVPTVDVTTTAITYSVSINATLPMQVNGMTRILGWTTTNVSTASTSGSTTSVPSQNALSMEIALDKSGSMLLNTNVVDTTQSSCIQYYTDDIYLYQYKNPISPCYIKKIAALKTAVGSLLDQLDAVDPKAIYVRTAGIAWSSQVDDSSALAWGTASTRANVISGLNATGGTDTTAPMTLAYNSLKTPSEATAQAAKGNTSFKKFIVLMTDGQNNYASSDASTLLICTTAKAAGYQIYTVAFMAPTAGKALLSACASNATNFFDAQNMSDLIAAFKTIGQQTSAQLTRMIK
jgi:Flp pilus assembly protein TadG